MSETPRQRQPQPTTAPAPRREDWQAQVDWLVEKGWEPLGDRYFHATSWYRPGFNLVEKYDWVEEPMTGEVQRYAAHKAAHDKGELQGNLREVRFRKQLRITPVSQPVSFVVAYTQQLTLEHRSRQEALKAAQPAQSVG